jgi:hypothetical protein
LRSARRARAARPALRGRDEALERGPEKMGATQRKSTDPPIN